MIVCELCTNCSGLAQLGIQFKKRKGPVFVLVIEEPINHTTSCTEYAPMHCHDANQLYTKINLLFKRTMSYVTNTAHFSVFSSLNSKYKPFR